MLLNPVKTLEVEPRIFIQTPGDAFILTSKVGLLIDYVTLLHVGVHVHRK